MGIGKDFRGLMEKIGYQFKDLSTLQCALTHSSYSHELKTKGFRADSNESLEFLGDAVLQIVISEELFYKYFKLGEGTLTKMRQSIVCEQSLAEIARTLSLGDYMNVGSGEETIGLREKAKALADTLEAVIAAVYIDDRENGHGVLYPAVVLSLFSEKIVNADKKSKEDYKSELQQLVEKNGDSVLTYECVERGPEHNKTFEVTAFVNNNKVGVGVGTTKRSAEKEAAKAALQLFGILK